MKDDLPLSLGCPVLRAVIGTATFHLPDRPLTTPEEAEARNTLEITGRQPITVLAVPVIVGLHGLGGGPGSLSNAVLSKTFFSAFSFENSTVYIFFVSSMLRN